MPARHYALRRFNPYRGVVQFVDLGDADARSLDGVTWHLRADDGHGWVRPVGVWVEGEGLRAGVGHRHPELLDALARRPALPFPLADGIELWLLDKETGLPLALLDACQPSRYRHGLAELDWIPFALTYNAFRSAALAERLGEGQRVPRHRDYLARMVKDRARPYAAAQWFRRLPDGGGEGLAGYRLEAGWVGRVLAADAFPELLVSEDWNNRLEKSVIRDYHAWLSPFLLCWPGLTEAMRARLEAAAWQRPQWLAQVWRLLPRVLDPAGLNAALVAARLQQAAGGPDNESLG
ncbi:MAG: hypothetical protein PHS77_12220 [Gallionellaceae bacterium]|nr:hypothetical protein [Gallionellaceae bacterium]